ncbi:hypothetical protein BV25DRAFT_1304698 [Artomyces pyxidatus]|uniref:Uncharacterized protein n=1 Tax=Artomyces pyxidatus TaxID=48021 RepID=A0ACB8SQ21_9AGAM|nr:hypothetical protein BV25DRAFT_1304698 [Artomyces pyxidatus]
MYLIIHDCILFGARHLSNPQVVYAFMIVVASVCLGHGATSCSDGSMIRVLGARTRHATEFTFWKSRKLPPQGRSGVCSTISLLKVCFRRCNSLRHAVL